MPIEREMGLIVLIRSNDIATDTRVQKYKKYFEKNGIKYKVLAWDRDGDGRKDMNAEYYNKITEYNLGEKALLARIGFMCFIMKKLIRLRRNISIIHACDIDTAFPAIVFGKLYGVKVIFDVFDWFSDTINIKNALISQALRIVEKFSVKHATHIILCEKERRKQIGKANNNKIFILPNIPDNDAGLKKENHIQNNTIVVSYVGGMYNDRNLEILLDATSTCRNVRLEIAGFGDKNLEARCQKMSEKFSNIHYWGRVDYSLALNIMNNSDVIYAMYCKTNRNHIFAAPNKYYESLMLGVPLITTEGTIVAEKTLEYDTGFIIGETKEDTLSLFEKLDRKILAEKAEKCFSLWESEYKLFFERFMRDKYFGEMVKYWSIIKSEKS